jgi:enoyl-CoA hydratase
MAIEGAIEGTAEDQHTVLYEKDPKRKVATITLNRPEQLNAVHTIDKDDIARLIAEINEDDDVKVVIIKGAGRTFCAGADVTNWSSKLPATGRFPKRRRIAYSLNHHMGRRGWLTGIATCLKATIAQVHGRAYGDGLILTLSTDMVVAANDARFAGPGFRYIGPICNWQVLINIGLKRAKEFTLTGRSISAQEALEWGMINQIVPEDKLAEATNELADSVARLPLDGIVMGKAQWEAALDAMGMHQGYHAAEVMHSLQGDGIHYEPGEFNMYREVRNRGRKGAIAAQREYFKDENW